MKDYLIVEKLEVFFNWDPVTIIKCRPKSGKNYSIESKHNKLKHGMYFTKSGPWFHLVRSKDDSKLSAHRPKEAFQTVKKFLEKASVDLLVFHGDDQ